MSTPEVTKSGFYGYPGAKEVVDIKFKYNENKNPVLRGMVLVIGAWMCVVVPKFFLVQS
jgi:hypothetical protein